MIEYEPFLTSKAALPADEGYVGADLKINPLLKPHQADICRWAIAGGRRAIFADFGLGKSVMQLQISVSLVAAFGGQSLIVCPLGVRQEFTRDARRFFDVDVQYVRTNEYTIELSPEYHADAVSYLRAAERDVPMPSLFDTLADGAA